MPRLREPNVVWINGVTFVKVNVFITRDDADRFLPADAVVAAMIRAMQLCGIERTGTIQLYPEKHMFVVNNIPCSMPLKVKTYIESGNIGGKTANIRFTLYIKTELSKLEVIPDDGKDDDPEWE